MKHQPKHLFAGIQDMINLYPNRFLLILTALFLAVGLWSFSGTNSRLLGPPFGDIIGQDFRQILRASRELQAGENIYQHALPFAEAPNFFEFISWQASPYPYSPIVAVFAIPLSRLDDGQALIVWTIISWILLFFCGVLCVYLFRDHHNTNVSSVVVLLMLLVFYACYAPVHNHMKLGQLDILILFLLLLVFWMFRRNSSVAGLFLGLAIAIKVLVAPMILFFVWKRKWRIVSIAILTTLSLHVVGFYFAGWNHIKDFMEVNYLWGTTQMLSYPFNQSVNGLVLRLFTNNDYIVPLFVSPVLASFIRYGIAGGSLILWIFAIRQSNKLGLAGENLIYGFTLTTIMFLSPLVDDVHYVWLLLPLSIYLLTAFSGLKFNLGLVYLVISILCALYIGNPDLNDAVYKGWESLAYSNVLVDSRYGLLTNAYLYGLIGLELSFFAYISYCQGSLGDNQQIFEQ